MMKPVNIQHGASIVEIMVAITIGSILLVGLIEIFISNKQAYRLQENISFMQENGRFAMSKLSDSIRMSDHWGGTDNSKITDATSLSISGIGSCNHAWITAFSTPVQGFEGASSIASTGLPSGCVSSSDYVANSDIIVLRYANASELVKTADLGKVSNPNYANTVFIRTSIDNGASAIVGAHGIPSSIPDEDGTYNYPYTIEVYYLRKCSNKAAGVCIDDIPTLTRLRLSADTGATPSLIEEPIAENIEQLQLQYGRDTNADGDVDRYDPASSLTANDWKNVVDVRISLIARSGIADNSFTDSSSYTLLDYSHTPATTDQRRHRKQYDRTVQIRNRTRQL